MGYVLIKDKKKLGEQDEEVIPLEEQIEQERALLKHDDLTPVTLESFKKWKEDKAKKKQAELEAKLLEAQAAGKKNKGGGILSGKALFTYDPTLFQDDDGAADDNQYEERVDSDIEEETKEEEPKKINDNNKQHEENKIEVDEELFKDDDAMDEEEVDFDWYYFI